MGIVLDFTRTRLGTGLPINLEDCDMREIAREEIEELRLHDPTVQIDVELAGDLRGHWDPTRVEQALSNLLRNAVQHGREGSPIRVAASAEDQHVILQVHNLGSAIPPAEQKLIFDPLRRAAVQGDARARDAGVGLGLYIARQIVEAHAGTIEVESSDAHGTTFTLRLPRRPRQGAASAGVT